MPYFWRMEERLRVIEAYEELIAAVPGLIKESGRTQKYIYDKLEWSREKWRRKKLNGDFTPDELRQIIHLIEGRAK